MATCADGPPSSSASEMATAVREARPCGRTGELLTIGGEATRGTLVLRGHIGNSFNNFLRSARRVGLRTTTM
jgi:hypothetical protein